MSLSKPYPIQKADISFGADALYGLIRDLISEGVVGSGDFAVTQRAAGANMSVDIAAGAAFVRVNNPEGGTRRVTNPATINTGTPGAPNVADGVVTTFAAADATNPRVDRVVLQVRDNNVDAGGSYDAVIKVVAGTPTAGADLTNLNGAAAVPDNAILLANVLVPAADTTIETAQIDTTIGTVRQKSAVGAGSADASGAAVVATTVAGLGAGTSGKIGFVRAGSSPFAFMPLVYDATYAKWVSPVYAFPMGADRGSNGAVAGNQTWGAPNGFQEQPLDAEWYELYTAGLRPQFALIVQHQPNSAQTGKYRLSHRYYQGTGNGGSVETTGSETELAPATIGTYMLASPWYQPTLGVPTDGRKLAILVEGWNGANPSANTYALIATALMRWVG